MIFRNRPYVSFPEAIQPPPSQSAGAVCLEIDAKWIPYILGALTPLAVDQTWIADRTRATGEARNLIEAFASAKACPSPVNNGIEMEDCMGCCLRWSDAGILQVLSCGEWVDVPGPGSMIPITGGSPAQGTPQPAPGGCESFIGKVLFFGRWLLPVPVNAGDQITVANCLGATTDYILDFPGWKCGDGTEFVAGGCIIGTGTTNSTDPDPTILHASLIAFDGTNYYDCGQAANGVNVELTIKPGVSAANLVFMINSAGPAGAGDLTFDVRICKPAAAPIAISYALGSGPAGVSIGQVVTMNSALNGPHTAEAIVWTFSTCCTISIVGYSGFVPHLGSAWWNYDDCSAVNHNGPNPTSGTVPTDFPAHTAMNGMTGGLAGDPSSAFSIQVKIESAP